MKDIEQQTEDMKKAGEEIADKWFDQEIWIDIGLGAVKIVLIMLISAILVRIGKAVIRNFFKMRSRSLIRFSERRETTLTKLLENVLTYVVYFIAILTVLGTLNVDVRGLIAGAGILGLAVGFGAQNLVKDVITGFFIIFEDQFSVGDYVRIDQFEGTVQEIGLRTTKILSGTGELHILPNGTISQVTNLSLHNGTAMVDVSIAYEGDMEKAEQVITELLPLLPDKYEELVKPPELLGIQQLGTSDVVLRVVAETLPMKHWYIARVLRKELKAVLDANGIGVPYPRMVMYTDKGEKGPAT